MIDFNLHTSALIRTLKRSPIRSAHGRVWLIAALILINLGQNTWSFAAAQPDGAAEYMVRFDEGLQRADKLAALQPLGGELIESIPQLGIDVVRFDRNERSLAASPDAILATLQSDQRIEYIEPTTSFSVADTTDNETLPQRIYMPLMIDATKFVPNDARLDQQYAWGMINAFRAWAIPPGNHDVVVAVIDSGVQIDHPDLAAKLVAGHDFVDDDAEPDDELGHGTHVTGTIGANTNNGIGVAGACPACRMMPIRVLDSSGNGSSLDVIKGIIFAADQGAQVINLSLVGSRGATDSTGRTMEDAVNYAWSKGAFLTCAAGNGSTSSQWSAYPAAFDRCFAVGATNSDDLRATYSNYGDWVELTAPGSNIFSTWRTSSYAYLSGTSMATPHVAGVAGLLAAQGLTNAEIEARLTHTADAISGTGIDWQHGRLNMLRALEGR